MVLSLPPFCAIMARVFIARTLTSYINSIFRLLGIGHVYTLKGQKAFIATVKFLIMKENKTYKLVACN